MTQYSIHFCECCSIDDLAFHIAETERIITEREPPPPPYFAALLDADGQETRYAGYARAQVELNESIVRPSFEALATFPFCTGASTSVHAVALFDREGHMLWSKPLPGGALCVNAGVRLGLTLDLIGSL